MNTNTMLKKLILMILFLIASMMTACTSKLTSIDSTSTTIETTFANDKMEFFGEPGLIPSIFFARIY